MEYMQRALTLARQSMGTTSPNPAVGAVVVKDSAVLGEGHTLPPGQAHAEVVALERAGVGCVDASLYVSLEPCCYYGRTPPCTKAIIAAGIGEVFVAARDPNPRVKGRGLSELESAGIKVYIDQETGEVQEIYEAFAKHVKTGIPFVTAKYAMSLDGKIATHTGDSKWVTGPAARRYVHEMRRTCDAIMVGVNTILRDDPQLTARDETGAPLPHQPLRVILDSTARTPLHARLLKEPGQTVIAVTSRATNRIAALSNAGAEVLPMTAGADGKVDLHALLQVLGGRGVVSLLVEGGGTLLGSLFDLGLVDKVVAFVAPTIIGGALAPSPVGGSGGGVMSQVARLERVRMEQVEGDILVVGYLPASHSSSIDLSPGRGVT